MNTSSSNDFDMAMNQGYEFEQVGDMFDDEEQFPIHETLQQADLDMFSYENQQTTQGCQQIVEEAKFFWSANRGSTTSSSDGDNTSNVQNMQNAQPMEGFFNQTITSTQ